jgi:uncharacterized membrane protein YgcG
MHSEDEMLSIMHVDSKRLNRLKRIAEAQQCKRWARVEHGLSLSSGQRMYGISGPLCVSDYENWGFAREAAAYIAEADPATILELLANLSSVTAERDQALAECDRLRTETHELRGRLVNQMTQGTPQNWSRDGGGDGSRDAVGGGGGMRPSGGGGGMRPAGGGGASACAPGRSGCAK